jgi:hypothetical protein
MANKTEAVIEDSPERDMHSFPVHLTEAEPLVVSVNWGANLCPTLANA